MSMCTCVCVCVLQYNGTKILELRKCLKFKMFHVFLEEEKPGYSIKRPPYQSIFVKLLTR